MEYSVNKLASISGVSARTLRYYDQIGLLCPGRETSNGYRSYGDKEVDRLQQILFWRELGMPLEEVGHILDSPDYDGQKALEGHLAALTKEQQRIALIIKNVKKSLKAMKGETSMTDKEKFEGFKKQTVEDNETAYGREVREKYGDDAMDSSNAKLMGMSEEKWQATETLRTGYEGMLRDAAAEGDPAGEKAQKACDMHRQWLCAFWKSGTYSKQAHLGICEMYVADDRFKAYYDKIAPGCAEFLRDAVKVYCSK